MAVEPTKHEPAKHTTQRTETHAAAKPKTAGEPETRAVSAQEIAKTAKEVVPYLKVEHSAPVPSASGKYVQHSSRLVIPPADARPANPRTTAEGRKADAKLRSEVRKGGGYDGSVVGHVHPAFAGTDPADRQNVGPQHPVQNGGNGTWGGDMEKSLKAKIANNKGNVVHEVRVTKTANGQDKWRTSIITDEHGVQSGHDVHYLVTKAQPKSTGTTSSGKAESPVTDLNGYRAKKLGLTVSAAAEKTKPVAEKIAPKTVETPTEAVIKAASTDSAALRYLGRGAGVVGLALSAKDLVGAGEESIQQHSAVPIAKEAVRQAGGWAGAWAGAEAGAALCAAVGIESGPGAVVTGLVGGVVGGVLGAMGVDSLL